MRHIRATVVYPVFVSIEADTNDTDEVLRKRILEEADKIFQEDTNNIVGIIHDSSEESLIE